MPMSTQHYRHLSDGPAPNEVYLNEKNGVFSGVYTARLNGHLSPEELNELAAYFTKAIADLPPDQNPRWFRSAIIVSVLFITAVGGFIGYCASERSVGVMAGVAAFAFVCSSCFAFHSVRTCNVSTKMGRVRWALTNAVSDLNPRFLARGISFRFSSFYGLSYFVVIEMNQPLPGHSAMEPVVIGSPTASPTAFQVAVSGQGEPGNPETQTHAQVQTPLVSNPFCTKCGTRAAADQLFCGKCGSKLNPV